MRIHQFIDTEQNTVLENPSYKEVSEAFEKSNSEFIAIISQTGELVGVIYKKKFEQLVENQSVDELIETKHLFDYFHILETIREFLKTEKNQLPVVDEEGFYLGVCKLSTIQYHFHRTMGITEASSLLVIQTKTQNYSLVDIARIVESNQAKVLMHYVATHPESENIEITLVLNKTELSDIITTFERFKYAVSYSSTTSDREDFLKERYNSLMHFLDI